MRQLRKLLDKGLSIREIVARITQRLNATVANAVSSAFRMRTQNQGIGEARNQETSSAGRADVSRDRERLGRCEGWTYIKALKMKRAGDDGAS